MRNDDPNAASSGYANHANRAGNLTGNVLNPLNSMVNRIASLPIFDALSTGFAGIN